MASGLDFLKSKKGIQNTYQRGDLNSLDYTKITEHRSSHNYVKSWIQFRQSGWGDCLRLNELPSTSYIRIARSENAEQSSAAIRINADLSNGSKQLLLLLNPHLENSTIPLDQKLEKDWKIIASIDRFNFSGIDETIDQDLSNKVHLPPLSLFLCVRPAWNG